MTGLWQKAGPVSSDVHIGGAGGVPSPSAGRSTCCSGST